MKSLFKVGLRQRIFVTIFSGAAEKCVLKIKMKLQKLRKIKIMLQAVSTRQSFYKILAMELEKKVLSFIEFNLSVKFKNTMFVQLYDDVKYG